MHLLYPRRKANFNSKFKINPNSSLHYIDGRGLEILIIFPALRELKSLLPVLLWCMILYFFPHCGLLLLPLMLS